MATIDRPKDEASAEPASIPPTQVAGTGDSVTEWAAPEQDEEFYFWGINELYVAP